MAEKIATLILKVDLDCHLCYKKIRKTLSKLQEKERIQSIYYDEKNQTVTISGPFDPKRLVKKICCKACKVIKDIQIKDNKEKPKDVEPAKEKPKDNKPVEQAKEKPKEKSAAPAEAKKDKPKDAPKPAAPAEPTKDKPSGDGKAKDAKPAEAAKANAKPAEGEGPKKDKPKAAEPVKTDPVASVKASQAGMVYQPAWQCGPVCYGRPGYDGYYGGYCNCGCANNTGYGASYGWIPESQPVVYSRPVYDSQPVMAYNRSAYETQPLMVYSEPVYGAAAYQTNKLFCEEDPQDSCTIM
ncbi:protein PYRICULARIA ORYZAE RESISTANCE 21-like [Iris pallida]|uniref:Protein PYRICULARIA ORYZAE RESISTANCE 21-like n=1 Tax=Iris pallida TaxID=29817 RepID=A0AAX6I875_IRIPA|nr:protein PYRICULARIA ORYZAE RESISTANCE 21-like [Iris pallida]